MLNSQSLSQFERLAFTDPQTEMLRQEIQPLTQEQSHKLFSTQPIDVNSATQSIHQLYEALGRRPTEIIFCHSPQAAVTESHSNSIKQKIMDSISMSPNLQKLLFRYLSPYPVGWYIKFLLCHQIKRFGWLFDAAITPGELLWIIAWNLRYGHLAVNPVANTIQTALHQVFEHCDWIIPLEQYCIICDRPRHIFLDAQNRPHALGKAAIEYADGCGLYAYHGITLPERYKSLHPHQWESRWILSERNVEIRRILIQEIGYVRLCQDLRATLIDSYREYALLRIDLPDQVYFYNQLVEEDPIFLLKMTCPSTGQIHVLRVPPDVKTAYRAIRWVNWGIGPESFAIQT